MTPKYGPQSPVNNTHNGPQVWTHYYSVNPHYEPQVWSSVTCQ